MTAAVRRLVAIATVAAGVAVGGWRRQTRHHGPYDWDAARGEL